jgi:hypothetical protein
VTHDSPHVKPVLQLPQSGGIDVDYRDLVCLFTGKLIGDIGTHLPGSEDKNIHLCE